MAGCPTEDHLQAFVEGTLSATDAVRVDAHIDECPECRKLVGEVGRAEAPPSATLPADAMTNETALQPGDLVGRFTLKHPLGAGAMAVVYAAYDPELDRTVALKLVHTRNTKEGSSTRSRVAREAKAIARLSHPNVVAVYETGTFRGSVFLAMELVDGGTLRAYLSSQPELREGTSDPDGWHGAPRGWREVLALFLQAGEGLAAAHAVGLVHRDFKPDNVLVGRDGRVRVGDFGLARDARWDPTESLVSRPLPPRPSDEVSDTVTHSGMLLGTPAYMAPEQMRAERADERSDIFAFSVALWEALYGKRPFDGANLTELLAAVQEGRLPKPSEPHDVPAWLRACVARGLSSKPEDRYGSMRELLDALRTPPGALAGRRLVVIAASAVALVFAAGLVVRAKSANAPLVAVAPPTASAASPPGDGAITAPAFVFHPQSARRVTFGDACEEFPVFTRDGKELLFAANVGPDEAIFALPVEGGAERRLTTTKGATDLAPDVSPDGRRVVFLRHVDAKAHTYVMDLDGTAPPRALVEGNLRPRWARDGKSVWAGDVVHPQRVDVETGAILEQLATPLGPPTGSVEELADGRLLALAATTGVALFGRERARESEPTWIYKGYAEEVLAATPDGTHALATRLEGETSELLAVAFDGSAPQSLRASGIAAYKGLRISPNGRSMAWSTCRAHASIAGVAGGPSAISPTGSSTFASLGPVPEWDVYDASWIPGTTLLAEIANRSGELRLWIVDQTGATSPRIVQAAWAKEEYPVAVVASPKGGKLALTYDEQGIASFDLASAALSPVGARGDAQPTFRYDESEVYFTRTDEDGAHRVMAVSAKGGTATRLLADGSAEPAASPVDDRVVYLDGARSEEVVPMVLDRATGKKTRLSVALAAGRYSGPRFSTNGKRVALIRAGRELVEVDAATGRVVRTVDALASQLQGIIYTDDDLMAVRGQWLGDVWMADDPF